VTVATSSWIVIARIVRPQGRKGEVIAEALSDVERRFETLRRAFLRAPGSEPRELSVESTWPHKGRIVLKFGGVDSIDEADRWRGAEVCIPAEEAPVLPPGSFYHHQLIGLPVFDTQGHSIGVLEELLETGAGAPVAVVRGSGGETLLPLAEPFFPGLDPAAGRLVVNLPESLDARG
jgi:16S rRNA processing protein RimM